MPRASFSPRFLLPSGGRATDRIRQRGLYRPLSSPSSRPPRLSAAWLEEILCEILSALLRGTGREYFMRCIIWPDVRRRFLEFTIVRAYAELTFEVVVSGGPRFAFQRGHTVNININIVLLCSIIYFD